LLALTASAATQETVPQLLRLQASRIGAHAAMREKRFGIWQTWTWSQVRKIVCETAAGLAERDMGRGDRIAILGANRPELYWAGMAIQSLGGVPVVLYNDATTDELEYVLEHCEARAIFVEDQEQADKVVPYAQQHGLAIWYSDPRGLRDYEVDRLEPISRLRDEGVAALAKTPGMIERSVDAGEASDLATICYTSGTTGRPKGVMLTYGNLLSMARATAELERLTEREAVLAYLPMAWIGDHFYSYVQATLVGFPVHCPESAATVMTDLREVGPTYFFAPPRVFEAILTDVHVRMENASQPKRWLYRRFMAVAARCGIPLLEGNPVNWRDRLLYALGSLLVYAPLRNTLGLRRIRVAYTAGEALGPEIFQFFRSLGINLKQVYGQTESSVYVCVHRDGDVSSETVGPPAPGVEVRIDERGQVLYRSPGVFKGYYKADDATQQTLMPDGWVQSGDAGLLTANGHLRVIDRAKDVGRLANGTLFAPKYLENRLKFSPWIKEAVAFGDQKSFVVALLNIELESVGNWAERRGLRYTSYADLASLPEVRELVADAVASVNASLRKDSELSGACVRRFLILHKELDADDGELTRTRKLRRNVIAERYASLVEQLYAGASQADVALTFRLEDGRVSMTRARLQIVDADIVEREAA